MGGWGMAMNIFTPEYIVFAVILIVVAYHIVKPSNTNEESHESKMNNNKSKLLH
jgi:hypothetical protein